MTGDGANEGELIYGDWEDGELDDPPTEAELEEWAEPATDPFDDEDPAG